MILNIKLIRIVDRDKRFICIARTRYRNKYIATIIRSMLLSGNRPNVIAYLEPEANVHPRLTKSNEKHYLNLFITKNKLNSNVGRYLYVKPTPVELLYNIC